MLSTLLTFQHVFKYPPCTAGIGNLSNENKCEINIEIESFEKKKIIIKIKEQTAAAACDYMNLVKDFSPILLYIIL